MRDQAANRMIGGQRKTLRKTLVCKPQLRPGINPGSNPRLVRADSTSYPKGPENVGL